MPKFEKAAEKTPPQPERARPEPAELAAFVAGAAVTAPPAPPAPPSSTKQKPRRGGSGLEMNVRFTPEEKAALERLAEVEDRSQQQILSRIAFPVLLEAARRLG